MPKIVEIGDFIQKIAQGITLAIGIDTQVVDDKLLRVAGTVFKPIPKNGGIVQKVIDTGEYAISTNVDRNSEACQACNQRHNCKELGYIHCPILYDNRIVGVVGLICYEEEQIDKIKDERRDLLNFVQCMCELITLKLKEEELHKKEQSFYQQMTSQNQILNLVIEQISDGYVLLDADNIVCNVNRKALNILKMSHEEVIHKNILDLIPDPAFQSMIQDECVDMYESVKIKDATYGTTFYIVANELTGISKILNFKTIENISSRLVDDSFKDNQITIDQIIGKSSVMRKLKSTAMKVAKTMPNILLTGETGTGKEMFARAIHHASDRKDNPFIAVNCAAIPQELLESELFGYDTGAFTGAKKGGKIGKFELANNGTILLDEIGDMPFHLQAKLLRVLQERKLERIGGNKQVPLNIRIISATNCNLEKMVEDGTFREDLYYRLNIFEINLPPLRERPEDIPLLAHSFVNKYRMYFGVYIEGISQETMEYLCNYSWKGNIRELENVIQYMISMSVDNMTGVIQTDALPKSIIENRMDGSGKDKTPVLNRTLSEIEDKRIREVLEKYGNTTNGKKQAAKELGISLATLYRRLKK